MILSAHSNIIDGKTKKGFKNKTNRRKKKEATSIKKWETIKKWVIKKIILSLKKSE